jgi:N-acetylmuramoyl-L-alanine amidase
MSYESGVYPIDPVGEDQARLQLRPSISRGFGSDFLNLRLSVERGDRRRDISRCPEMGLRMACSNLGFLCRRTRIFVLAAILLIPSVPAWAGTSRSERMTFQRSIADKRAELHQKYKKIPRKKTKYVIVHTSEAGLGSTLNSVLKGKRVRGGRTGGGHTHYVIARNGRTYRILDKRYIADHAGTSMWKGETNISKVSLAIELVGYHYTSVTKQQYRSIGILIDILSDAYGLNDRAVLTHSQIAYGKPNRWVRTYHRGRKKCAKNFDRGKAGLGPTWPYDPDVRAGRLNADPKLAAIFYAHRKDAALLIGSNTITPSNPAWSIAGEDYDDHATLYRLPNGRLIPGNEIENRIGWNRLPEKTVVLLNQSETPLAAANQGPVKTISDGLTAWALAGPAYHHGTTFYFFPEGVLKSGQQINDWDDLPSNTMVIIGYLPPQRVTAKKPPVRIAGNRYDYSETLYYFPDGRLIAGDQIKDFSCLPRGTQLFLPSREPI